MTNKDILYGTLLGLGALVGVSLLSGGFQPIDIVKELPKNANKSYSTRNLSNVDTIVVHHAAVNSTLAGSTPTAVANFHINQYDWPGIAYHIVVMPNGQVLLTNYLETESYHTGTLNPRSIGILVMGDFDTEQFTPTQEASLVKAIKWVQKKVGKKLKVGGHYQFSSKTCPGMNVRAKLDEVVQKSGAIRWV